MALTKCSYCENEISDKAKKCPYCGKKNKYNNKPIYIAVVIIAILSVVAVLVNKIQKVKETRVETLLVQVDEYYKVFDYDSIKKCLDELDDLSYNTSKQREILEYDNEVYEDAYSYYVAIKNVDEKL